MSDTEKNNEEPELDNTELTDEDIDDNSDGGDFDDDNDDDDDDDDEYETVDITENEQYQVGSAFFENQDGEGIAEILTNLVKVHISLVDCQQDMIRKQSEQISATNTLSKLLQKYCKKLDEKI
mgnify:CR=1 FL=1